MAELQREAPRPAAPSPCSGGGLVSPQHRAQAAAEATSADTGRASHPLGVQTPPNEEELQPGSQIASPPPLKRPRLMQPDAIQPAAAPPAPAAAAATSLEAAPEPGPTAAPPSGLGQAPWQQAQASQVVEQPQQPQQPQQQQQQQQPQQPAPPAAAPGSSWQQVYEQAQQPPALADSAGLAAGLLVLTDAPDIPAAIAEIQRVRQLPSPLAAGAALARHYCEGCNRHISYAAFIQVGAPCHLQPATCNLPPATCSLQPATTCHLAAAAVVLAALRQCRTRPSQSCLLPCRASWAPARPRSCSSGAPPASSSQLPARQAPSGRPAPARPHTSRRPRASRPPDRPARPRQRASRAPPGPRSA